MEISGMSVNSLGLPKIANDLKLKNVFFPGFIADENLRSFLAEADLFLFPSLYEGFGFPPLEAMACGTATISSNTGSLPEIIQDGGILAEPNPEIFAEEIIKLMENQNLREKLSKKGLEVAKTFTWEKAAKETKEIYNNILNS